MDPCPVRLGQAEQLSDHLRRQRADDLVHELDVATLGRVHENRAGDLTHAMLERGDDASRELGSERLAIRDVPRRVHRQQHLSGAQESFGVEVLEYDTSRLAGEDHRISRHVHDVGMSEHRPVPGFARHLLPVHRIGSAEFGERLVRRTRDVGVRIVEIDCQLHGQFPLHA
jgi:hypothetical protein